MLSCIAIPRFPSWGSSAVISPPAASPCATALMPRRWASARLLLWQRAPLAASPAGSILGQLERPSVGRQNARLLHSKRGGVRRECRIPSVLVWCRKRSVREQRCEQGQRQEEVGSRLGPAQHWAPAVCAVLGGSFRRKAWRNFKGTNKCIPCSSVSNKCTLYY